MKNRIIIFCAILLFCVAIAKADVIFAPIDTISQHTYDVIEGKVINVDVKWGEYYKYIYTYTTIRVDRSYRNKISEEEIIIKEFGGRLDGFITSVECNAEYAVDENILVFLQPEGQYYRTYALNQGKFNITYDINQKKQLKRKVDPNELRIIYSGISRNDIKDTFNYDDIISIIQNYSPNGNKEVKDE